MKLSKQEQQWVEDARRQQIEFNEEQDRIRELRKAKEDAALGRATARRLNARGGTHFLGSDPADLSDPGDAEARRQAEIGRRMARTLEGRDE